MVLKDAFFVPIFVFLQKCVILIWRNSPANVRIVHLCSSCFVRQRARTRKHADVIISPLCTGFKKEPKPLRKKTVAAFFARTFVNNWHGQSHDKAIRVPHFSLAMILLRYLKQIRSEMGNFRTSCLIFSSFISLSLSFWCLCLIQMCFFEQRFQETMTQRWAL